MNCCPPKPGFTGVRVLDDYPLAELVDRIDWTPFFQTWELSGRYPQILDDAIVGAEHPSAQPLGPWADVILVVVATATVQR